MRFSTKGRTFAALIATLALSVVFAATPALAVPAWTPVEPLSSLNGAADLKDLSGATFTPDGTLWSVDNKLNEIGSWSNTASGWQLSGRWDISQVGAVSITDPEGISWIDGAQFVVVDEDENALIFLSITPNGPALERVVDLDPWAPPVVGDGLEAVAYSHDESNASTDILYVGDETTAVFLRVEIPVGSAVPSAVTSVDFTIPEIAGLADDPQSSDIYLLSEADKTVYRTTTAGASPIALFSVPAMTQPEGIFFDAGSGIVHVIGEGLQEHSSWRLQEPAKCDNLEVTIDMNLNGGSGIGTLQDDVILGTPGSDVIKALGGNDVVCGGGGVDRIEGGGGDDRIFGEGGSDRIWGHGGNDEIFAGSGADKVYGGPGDDQIFGQGGQDRLYGNDGDDLLQGNAQSDLLSGGDGDDTLRGSTGKDELYGGSGNDELYGGDNTDYLDGGAGVDDMAHGQRGKDNPVVPGVSGCVDIQEKFSC